MSALSDSTGPDPRDRVTRFRDARRDPSRGGARVRGLGDLAATVPYLLGFVPRESLTFLGLHGQQVVLTARMDLADATHARSGDDPIRSVLSAIVRAGGNSLLALVSSERPVDESLVERVGRAAAEHGLDLVDIGWHADGRCHSLLCAAPGCCPPEGVAVDPACPAAVHATYAGRVALPDRTDVEAEFDRPANCDVAAVLPWLEVAETAAVRAIVEGRGESHRRNETDFVLQTAARFDRAARPGAISAPLSDQVVARLVVGLGVIAVRDGVWMALDDRSCHGQGLWLELAQRVPSPYDAAPLFLLGWRCWRAGDGIRAGIAADRALASDLRCSAATLLLDALAAGIGPGQIPPLGQDPFDPVRGGPLRGRRLRAAPLGDPAAPRLSG